MRVFHFVSREYGLDDIRRRRLKIATIPEINDPFELFGVNLADERLRHAFTAMKNELASAKGLLCFSKSWNNPVQWSHYAEKHRGLCLGFDVPDEHLCEVRYSRRRLVIQTEALRNPRALSVDTAIRFLFTKYSHWRYENEVRSFVSLDEKDAETGLYFVGFSDRLRLATVVVGAQSTVTRTELNAALGNLTQVDVFKGRLAFNSFRVVRQQSESAWG